MLHCFASEEPTQWEVVILAAPKELLMEKGEANVAVCKRHGEIRPESEKLISGSYLVMEPDHIGVLQSFTAAFCAGSAGSHGFGRVAK